MDFHETLTIKLPNIEETLADYSVAEFRESHGLIVELASIHAGITANFNQYDADELEKAIPSWTTPYPKPIILHHNPETEPMGRVISARMEKEEDGTPFTMLQVAITDPAAIQKIQDKRYLTGSVGGKAEEALCSVCGKDWVAASMATGAPCKHVRGRMYEGQLASLNMKGIGFKEYSFVNMPADQRSSIRLLSTTMESESNAKFFSIDMNHQSVKALEESGNREILETLKKKEAAPIYLGLKGSFLTALAINTIELEEKVMTEAVETVEQEENVLDVVNQLSQDLSDQVSTEETVVEETDEKIADETVVAEGTEVPADENTQETPEGEVTEETTEEVVAEEKVVEENNEDADAARQLAELNEKVSSLEPLVAELQKREASLLDENAKLRSAIKRSLAERVVDAKILIGAVELAVRDAQIIEHLERSFASLADSLRDLAQLPKMASAVEALKAPKVDEELVAVEDDVPVESKESEVPVIRAAEDVFVDAFMGRLAL